MIVPASRTNIVLLKHINKLRECRCHPNSALILYTLISLSYHLFYNKCKVFFFLLILCFIQIHKYCNERSLTVGSHQSDHLILYCLYTLGDFLTKSVLYDFFFSLIGNTQTIHLSFHLITDLLSAYIYKRCKMSK